MIKLNFCPAHDTNLSTECNINQQFHAVVLHDGVLHAGEDIEPGTLHAGEDIEPGTLHAGEDVEPWTFHLE